ncbi:helix-turn-helix domain-containing protein [Amycolatopsis sp. NPDC049159]|uniref:helix-turn-helix domain-containing protein n=1 Tax=Amycolatopsis sp. NPDC049159 TaxID=3157210 RepID=UPI0033E43B7A
MTTSQPIPGPAAAAIARAIVAGVRHAVPEHAPLFDADATAFAGTLVANPRAGTSSGAGAFRRAGVAEHAAGGELDRLVRAYQAGGRCALPVVAALSHRAGAGVVGSGVEAVLRCVDVLIGLSTEGYRAAQRAAVTDVRADLLHALLAGQGWADLAGRANWPVPERVVAVVVAPGACVGPFGAEVLADLSAASPYLVLPADTDPGRVVGGTPAATGPAVPPAQAATSLHWARRTWNLRRRGLAARDPVVHWTDHVVTHCLLADESLTGALAARSLAPLSGLPPKTRDKLVVTLHAMLDARGGAPEIAARLGVHPQTARNRTRRLQALFGSRLEDPEERLSLRIAVRADRVGI